MDERTYQFRVGVVVIATLLIGALLVALISDPQWLTFRGRYPIRIVLQQAPGVAEGTPVRKNGVLIGRVAAVDLTDDGVEVMAMIDANRRLRHSEVARVRTSILGDAVIEFIPGPQPSDEIIEPGETIQGQVREDPIQMIIDMRENVEQSLQSVGEAGTEVATLARRVNTLLDEVDTERLEQLINRTDRALLAFTNTMENVDKILGDEQLLGKLREGIEQLPLVIADARDTMARVQQAVESADQNLRNLQGLTEPLGEQGDEIVASLESAVSNLDSLLGQVAQFTKSINNSEGTIGQLFNNPQLYDDVISLIAQIKGFVRTLRPIRDDVRAFTNRLALRGIPGVILPRRTAVK